MRKSTSRHSATRWVKNIDQGGRRKAISSSLYRLLVGLIFVLGVSACHDQATAPKNVPPEMSVPGPLLSSAAIPGYAIVSADEQAAGEYLARTLALSLARADLRLEVKMAIATSVMKEHKLHFASFLQGRGGRIVSAMDQVGSSVASVQSAVARVRDLEFYMPGPAHRQKWTGGEDLLVGVLLSEKGVPIAFNTRGERITLSTTELPSTPTLFLVPNETDLSAQIALNRQGRAAVTCLPIATESLEAAGARCTGTSNSTLTSSAGFVPTTRSSKIAAPSAVSNSSASDPQIIGLYAQFLRLLDDGEPPAYGEAEIEIHVVGKQSREDGSLHDYQCSGEHAASLSGSQPGIRDRAYVFDQNDHFWNGSVLLVNNWQLEEIQRDEREGFLITVWEDDNEACAIREDADITLQELINQLRGILPTARVAIRTGNVGAGAVVAFGMVLYSLSSFLAGGDDLLGSLTDKRETSYADSYPDNTHVLLKENGGLNGRATLNVVSSGRYASVSGPTQAYPGQQAYFSASAVGTSGALTYTFTATAPDGNGPSVIQSGPASSVYYSNSNPGTYSIGVGVTDSYGSVGEASQQVVISTAPSVSISGPTQIRPGDTCTWSAVVSGGSPPYSYWWTIDGANSGTSYEATGRKDPGNWGSSFVVSVSVTDAVGSPGNAQITVFDDPSAGVCFL